MADLPPPARPPDFVGVGAQRCGTTWWFELICEHPEVQRGPKELHFFDRFCRDQMGARDVEAYHAHFATERDLRAGEWTPRYAHDFWTPRLLNRAAPEARLIMMVRDPIARLRSGVVHQATLTPPATPVDLATIYAEAAARGCYARQLARVLEHFERDRVLVLQYERCCNDPIANLRRTYRFIDVDETFIPGNFAIPRGSTSESGKSGLPRDALAALVAELSADVAQLMRLVPDLEPELWTELQAAKALPGRV